MAEEAELRDAGQALHQGQPIRSAGMSLRKADAVVVALHGRGSTAESILAVADELLEPCAAFLAPQAANSTWYPLPFIAPVEGNEPYLTSALSAVEGVLNRVREAGIPPEKVLLLGFSQGACLALEFAARNARRYGGVVGLSGGLIGDHVDAARYRGDFAGTPVFLGCSDVDPHIPLERVRETAAQFRAMGALVDEQIYPGMFHTVNHDEVLRVIKMLDRVCAHESVLPSAREFQSSSRP